MKDYYKVLEVSRNASPGEIKRAYRKLAFLYHPDRNQSAAARVLMQEINEAYTHLGDPVKREHYNLKYDFRVLAPDPSPGPRSSYTSPGKSRQEWSKTKGSRVSGRKKFDYSYIAYKGKFFAAFFLIYTSLLCLDYLFEIKVDQTIVESIENEKENQDGLVRQRITSSKVDFVFTTEGYYLGQGDTLRVSVTPIFGIVKELFKRNSGIFYEIPCHSIFSNFFIVVVIVILSSLGAIFLRKPENRIASAVLASFSFILVIYFNCCYG